LPTNDWIVVNHLESYVANQTKRVLAIIDKFKLSLV